MTASKTNIVLNDGFDDGFDDEISSGNKYLPEGIDHNLDRENNIVSLEGQAFLAEGLSYLPKRVIDFAIKKIIFSDLGDPLLLDAHYLDFQTIRTVYKGKQGMIFFHPDLWGKKEIKIYFVIAHELAHAIHRDVRQKKTNLPLEEKADRTAIRWLSKHFTKATLEKEASHLMSKRRSKK